MSFWDRLIEVVDSWDYWARLWLFVVAYYLYRIDKALWQIRDRQRGIK